MIDSARPELPRQLLQKLHAIEHWRHWVRVAVFIALYALAAVGATWISARFGWGVALPLYLLAGAALHGISLFTHEAVHGTLCTNPFWNRVAGALCAIPVLQNCSAYRVLHLRHHQHLGDDGDPDHYANYTRWSWLVFTMNWLRLIAGYPVYIVAIPILGFKHGTTRDRLAILAEIGATAAIVVWVMSSQIPADWLVHGWLVPMIFINTMVNIRGMSQHTLLEHTSDEILGTRTILTYPIVRFFMCNENYHLEHHLWPGVPWYQLPAAHSAAAPELKRRGAPYIRSYWTFVREFCVRSIERSPWNRR